jgi:hypothetical protein
MTKPAHVPGTSAGGAAAEEPLRRRVARVHELDLQLIEGQLAGAVESGDHRERADDLAADAEVRADHEFVGRLGRAREIGEGGLRQLDERTQFLVEWRLA